MQKPNYPETRETINVPPSITHLPESHMIRPKIVHNVQIKGTLTGTNPKTIEIQPTANKFIIYSSQKDLQKGKTKSYALNQVTFKHQNRQEQGKKDYLHIDTNAGKKYIIQGDNSGTIANQIQKSQVAYQINNYQFQQQPITMVPKQVSYLVPMASNQFQKRLIPTSQVIFKHQYPILSHVQHIQQQLQQDLSDYPRRNYYLNPQDWKVDHQKGSILFINEEKKSNQKRVITWVIKKFLTTRSFMGISYPTFVMKPQSILQSYAKAIGAAPWLFEHVSNPVERMKKFICLIHTFSLLFCDTIKPFNPPLGQTFQATIANGNFYAEQVCHHPPISAFFYQGKGYKLYGSSEMAASIGPNSARGSFIGDMKISFDDGVTYVGRLPCGQFSGFILGDEKFQTYGTFYAYNNKKLVFSGSTIDRRNFFEGYIGKLKPKQEQDFYGHVNSPDRFSKFPFYDRQSFDAVFSFMEMNYGCKAVFDGKEYFNTQDPKCRAFVPEPIKNEKLLLNSDSRLRKDIHLRAQLKFDEAQKQKQKLQDEERYFRKLRAKYDPAHHPHS